MASFSKGTSFTDGVTGDVTAAKLHALVDAATPVGGLVTDRTAKTSVVGADLALIADSADSNNLKKVSITNLANNLPTAVITAGTVTTLNSTTGTITTATIPTLTAGTTTGTAATFSGDLTIADKIIHSGDTNTMVRFPSNDTVTVETNGTEAMRIDSSGNVGIGTTSPAYQLSVHKAGLTGIEVKDTTNSVETNLVSFSSGGMLRTYTNHPLIFRTNDTERLRIDSSGNVGIGQNSPNASLVISKINTALSGGSNPYGVYIYPTSNGDCFIDALNVTPNSSSLILRAFSNGTYTKFIESVNGNTTIFSTAATERLRIDSSGNVGIGTNSPSAQLELSTDSAKKPSTNTWTIASDERLKTNIVEADKDRCYEIVKEVPLKRYTWKSEVYSQEQVKDRSKLGWIAQDVEAVFPKAVGTNRFAYNQVFEDVVTPELDSDGNAVLDENGVAKTKTEKRLVSEEVIEDCKDLNSDQIYAAMYGTIQKLIEKVETLESKVAALEAA